MDEVERISRVIDKKKWKEIGDDEFKSVIEDREKDWRVNERKRRKFYEVNGKIFKKGRKLGSRLKKKRYRK